MNDLRTDAPTLRRDLVAVVRFVDAFTGQPVRTPLAVRIPTLNWQSLRWDNDATYRFSLTNPPLAGGAPILPTGVFQLEVTVPGGSKPIAQTGKVFPEGPYAAFEPRRLTLPLAPHSPPLATDYRVDLKLWPTVAFRPPPGETAVVGKVIDTGGQNVVGLKVVLLDASTPPPPNPPYTRTDGNGQFLFRLPDLECGKTPNPTATLDVRLFDAADNPLTVTPPTTLTIPIGQTTNFLTLNFA